MHMSREGSKWDIETVRKRINDGITTKDKYILPHPLCSLSTSLQSLLSRICEDQNMLAKMSSTQHPSVSSSGH
jgi:hypothetical protein